MFDYESMKSNPLAFVKRRTITSAYIDSMSRMGIAQTALMVQDNITGNFGEIDCDNLLLNKLGAYWVLTRSKFHFYKRPFFPYVLYRFIIFKNLWERQVVIFFKIIFYDFIIIIVERSFLYPSPFHCIN